MYKTTGHHKKYWANRNIDWKSAYLDTINHPHRQMIMDQLRKIRFGSLLEIGCASGPNLLRIKQEFPRVQVGGVDISQKAIETARQALGPLANLDVSSGEDVFFGDKCADVVLTDMTLIYFGPRAIHRVMKEIVRTARRHVVLCEFHSESAWKRWGLRFASGYNAYDYRKLLKRYDFYDIVVIKIPNDRWPKEDGSPADDLENQFRYVITAKI